MTIGDICTTDPATCAPHATLEHVILMMAEADCGFIPVINRDGSIAGVITDRDVCLTLASHRRTPAHIAAEQAMKHPVFSCFIDDDVAAALDTMRQHRVRRLPVVNRSGRLHGVLSMNDIVLATTRTDGPSVADVIAAMHAICAHRSVELAAV
jgi:CBS domain-containing protein